MTVSSTSRVLTDRTGRLAEVPKTMIDCGLPFELVDVRTEEERAIAKICYGDVKAGLNLAAGLRPMCAVTLPLRWRRP